MSGRFPINNKEQLATEVADLQKSHPGLGDVLEVNPNLDDKERDNLQVALERTALPLRTRIGVAEILGAEGEIDPYQLHVARVDLASLVVEQVRVESILNTGPRTGSDLQMLAAYAVQSASTEKGNTFQNVRRLLLEFGIRPNELLRGDSLLNSVSITESHLAPWLESLALTPGEDFFKTKFAYLEGRGVDRTSANTPKDSVELQEQRILDFSYPNQQAMMDDLQGKTVLILGSGDGGIATVARNLGVDTRIINVNPAVSRMRFGSNKEIVKAEVGNSSLGNLTNDEGFAVVTIEDFWTHLSNYSELSELGIDRVLSSRGFPRHCVSRFETFKVLSDLLGIANDGIEIRLGPIPADNSGARGATIGLLSDFAERLGMSVRREEAKTLQFLKDYIGAGPHREYSVILSKKKG